jgi:hypothetical protein
MILPSQGRKIIDWYVDYFKKIVLILERIITYSFHTESVIKQTVKEFFQTITVWFCTPSKLFRTLPVYLVSVAD